MNADNQLAKTRTSGVRSSNPTVIDLFSGAGLFSLGFQLAGFRLLQAIELDPIAAATYAKNLGDHITVADISRIKPAGSCDVLVAGPPCQGFSTLGRRQQDDPRNALSLQVVKWAKVLQPKIVVVENVAAFLTSPQWTLVAKGLARLGYDVEPHLLNAFDFGVPQLRKRSFTIASRVGPVTISRPRRSRCRSVREAWDGLSTQPDGRNHHTAPLPSALALARMRKIPAGGDKRDVMKRAPNLTPRSWWGVSCEVTDAWGRMEWDAPCNTLRTCLQNPSKGRYIHPDQHRVISLREAARLHTIPDRWQFTGLPTQIARQIGNSVPPALGRAIAESVRLGLV